MFNHFHTPIMLEKMYHQLRILPSSLPRMNLLKKNKIKTRNTRI